MSLSGVADLPLHTGHVPKWLISRMLKLAKIIVKLVVEEYGIEGFLHRIANPLWFQALNNIIGMDWDSSGSTTVTSAVLKHVLRELDLGIVAVGGKGRKALSIPEELESVKSIPLDEAKKLRDISRIVAKVDQVLVQDGYTLYHQLLLARDSRLWCIVQQGMNVRRGLARRYHWISTRVKVYDEEPHEGIAGYKHENILNLTSKESRECKKVILDLVNENPHKIVRLWSEVKRIIIGVRTLDYYTKGTNGDVKSKTTIKLEYYYPIAELKPDVLRRVYELKPLKFQELLLIKGLGPSVVRALALIAELIYETPPSRNDPVNYPLNPFKYAYAMGGKDGVPYPINREVYDKVIVSLESIIGKVRDLKLRRILLKNLAKLTASVK